MSQRNDTREAARREYLRAIARLIATQREGIERMKVSRAHWQGQLDQIDRLLGDAGGNLDAMTTSRELIQEKLDNYAAGGDA